MSDQKENFEKIITFAYDNVRVEKGTTVNKIQHSKPQLTNKFKNEIFSLSYEIWYNAATDQSEYTIILKSEMFFPSNVRVNYCRLASYDFVPAQINNVFNWNIIKKIVTKSVL